MFHKRLQLRPLPVPRPSVLGDGLPERLRSTLVALFGIAAAVGLTMVALVLQQGFPLVSSGPVPDPPPRRQALEDRVVAKQAAATPGRAAIPVAASSHPPVPRDTGGSAPADSAAPREAGSVAVPDPGPPAGEAAPVPESTPARGESAGRQRPPAAALPPSSQPVAQAPVATVPAPEPIATSSDVPEPAPEPEPGPAPETAPEPAASAHPGNGHAYGKGNGNGAGSSGGPPGKALGLSEE